MGVTSLILGIIGLLISLFGGLLNWVGSIMGVIGIIFGALGRKKEESKGIATAGLVLSILATIFGLALFLACSAIMSSF